MGVFYGLTTKQAAMIMELIRIAQKHNVKLELSPDKIVFTGEPQKKEAVEKDLKEYLLLFEGG